MTSNSASTIATYRSAIGRSRAELTTPALILDINVVRRNIAAMAAWSKDHAKARPHCKIHKCLEIARMQVAAGAIGITAATVWETVAMVQGGLDNILIANQVVGEEKLRLLAATARHANILVAVDHSDGAQALSRAAAEAGSQIGVLIDIDIGLRRGGVRSDEEALRVADLVTRAPVTRPAWRNGIRGLGRYGAGSGTPGAQGGRGNRPCNRSCRAA